MGKALRYTTSIVQAKLVFYSPLQEVRVDDYIQSYKTNGFPPQAVAQVPTGDKERLALGLLPLFKPISEHDPVLADRPKDRLSDFSSPRKTNSADIPTTQDFKGEKVGTETFFTICCSEPYTWFSPEVRFPTLPARCRISDI